MPPLSIAIIEDEPAEMESLRSAVESGEFECVGAYRTAEGALKALPALQPRAVIVDLALPRMSGVRCIWELRRKLTHTEFLVHTVEARPQQVFEALQAGASGYLIKGAPAGVIREALREVIEGGSPITPSIARLVLKQFQSRPSVLDHEIRFSFRQDQVLTLLSQGLSNKEIARQLGLGINGVKSHVRVIYKALQVHSRWEFLRRYGGQPDPER